MYESKKSAAHGKEPQENLYHVTEVIMDSLHTRFAMFLPVEITKRIHEKKETDLILFRNISMYSTIDRFN